MQTIIASETNTGFNFCTTEFSGEIENIGYNLYHYYDAEEKIDRLTSKGATRSLWPSEYDIEVYDETRADDFGETKLKQDYKYKHNNLSFLISNDS